MRQVRFGSTTIDRVVEVDRFWVDPGWLYPEMTTEMVERHKVALGPDLVEQSTNKLCLSFHSYLVRTRTANILVDTCNGNHKHRPRALWQHMFKSNQYLSNLARLGISPADIDFVLCSHLHTDHVGWNTVLADGKWIPTFPKAKYIFAKQEFEQLLAEHLSTPALPVGHGSFADSILPVVEAGQAMLVDMQHCVDGDLVNGVWLEGTAGHTPGHVAINVAASGQHALMTGDIFHHPIIFLEPDFVTTRDWNPELGRATRQRIAERMADTSSILLTMHFPTPTAGRILANRQQFHFQYLR